ncbi:hypothetical protein Tco_0705524 [Tanacetum coccineum]|uniref:Uncharacterized protein n=1 Tax=Tanacetum coccineum TaxID=301880 RepID=A0ABQ4Y6C3_9ASTR
MRGVEGGEGLGGRALRSKEVRGGGRERVVSVLCIERRCICVSEWEVMELRGLFWHLEIELGTTSAEDMAHRRLEVKARKFSDSYKALLEEPSKSVSGEGSAKKKGRTVAITTEDMQKQKNDIKARTTLLLALPNEHQLRFSKYDTAKEL